ncbi:hypothetical protein L0Y65_01970 [Candidatus Micrarchaeota archaeon]|nr:hypothetical protein [Candidatus Micrarchaeota archaeon]
MTSHKVVAALLLLIGIFSAFNLSDYIYPEEKNATISFTNYTEGGFAYSIVRINGADTFLLKGGEPLTDQSEIESAMYSYYVRTYYPTPAEIAELEAFIKQFNDSRNNGYDFKNKEEYVCRDDILLSNGKITISGVPVRCTDNQSCLKNAMLLFSVYGQGLGLGSPTVIIGPLTEFTPASLKMDGLLANYTYMLSTMNDSNVVENINYIKDTSGELKNLSLTVESTIFRTPRLNDSVDRAACQLKCWAICPSFDLDQAAADAIKTKSAALAAKLAPLSDFQGASDSIYDRTVTRMEHVRQDNMATYYDDVFAPLNKTGAMAIADAEEALGRVQNNSFGAKLDSLKSLHATIPEDISAHHFDNLDADIGEYSNLTEEVRAGTGILMGGYNATLEAKNLENSLLIVLESKDLDPVSLRSLELLKNQTSDLDAQFRDGLSLAELAALESNYTSLTKIEQDLLKSESETPATRVLLLFRGFARKVNSGIASVAEKTEVVPRSEIPEGPATLGLFSLLVFLSFSSIAMLVFLYIFSTTRFTIPKTSHILLAAFLCVVVLLFVFSFMMYLFLGKTSTDATLPEFLADFGSRNSTSILVDVRNASFSDANAMRMCASTLASSLAESNKSWSLYVLTPSTCTKTDSNGGNETLESSECLGETSSSESSFLLGYSPKNEPPKFSVIYQTRAEIRSNLDYYESCPLVALFS